MPARDEQLTRVRAGTAGLRDDLLQRRDFLTRRVPIHACLLDEL
jgi:hypothetical protein